jgi:hypothetical protein
VLTDSKDKRERERGIPEKKHLGARKERDGEKGIQTMPCPMPMHTMVTGETELCFLGSQVKWPRKGLLASV